MKTTRLFAAALALLSVFSCQKEEQQVINNFENEGGALITCTFANNDAATKTTTTDGLTPLWAEGDEIMLYDGSSKTQKLILALSGTASSTEGIIDGTDATKFTFAKPSGWTKVYAIYPSSACVSGFSASDPKINYAGQDGTFAKANICAAAESSGTMSFKNVGAILKFTSKSVKVAKVAVPAAGLANNFKVSFDGANPSLASESASNSNEFSIGTGSGAVYIGVPAGSIAASSKFTYETSDGAELGNYTTGADNTVKINEIYNLGAMMGVLPGLFTVSAGTDGTAGTADDVKVQFSKGNLQATVDASGTPTAWNFATYQYGYIGNAEANTSIGTTAGVVDLFGWSTSKTSYGIITSEDYHDYTGEFEDWGGNAIANGGNTADQWSTLSMTEWKWILGPNTGSSISPNPGTNCRTSSTINGTANARYAEVEVNGVCGLLIFPDAFTWPEGITTSMPSTFNAKESNWNSVDYTASEFNLLESAGCVFLPAVGDRSGSSVVNVGYGYYWSSMPSGEYQACDLSFGSEFVYPLNVLSRYYGISVRLACAAQ